MLYTRTLLTHTRVPAYSLHILCVIMVSFAARYVVFGVAHHSADAHPASTHKNFPFSSPPRLSTKPAAPMDPNGLDDSTLGCATYCALR